MTLDKPTLALILIGCATVTLAGLLIFPNDLLEFFGGSILAILLFQENERFKLTKKERRERR